MSNQSGNGKAPLIVFIQSPHFQMGFRDRMREDPYRLHYEFHPLGKHYEIGRHAAAFAVGRGMGKSQDKDFMEKVLILATQEGL